MEATTGFYTANGQIYNLNTQDKSYSYSAAVKAGKGREPFNGNFIGGDGKIDNIKNLGGISEEDKAQLDKNTADIATLNGTGDGSVKKTVDDAIALVVDEAPEAFDTLKKISDWINTHSSSAIEMDSRIQANEGNIETLQSEKANKSDTYTKMETDNIISNLNDNLQKQISNPFTIITAALTNTLEYPFNDSKTTIAFESADERLSTNYTVHAEVTEETGGNAGRIIVSDKLLNGFKIEYTGGAGKVNLKIYVQGGFDTNE